jgi:hypothetical protein
MGLIQRLLEIENIHIVMACRTISKAEASILEISELLGIDVKPQISIIPVDLSDPHSCIQFSASFRERF